MTPLPVHIAPFNSSTTSFTPATWEGTLKRTPMESRRTHLNKNNNNDININTTLYYGKHKRWEDFTEKYLIRVLNFLFPSDIFVPHRGNICDMRTFRV